MVLKTLLLSYSNLKISGLKNLAMDIFFRDVHYWLKVMLSK